MAERLLLATIRRARGIRGEVLAHVAECSPDRFQPGLQVQLGSDREERTVTVESAWMHNGDLVLKFAGMDTRNQAEELRGLEICVPLEQRRPPPEGEYYLSDLVGCTVETPDGRIVGTVVAWHDFGATPLLEVRDETREVLVPFTDTIYRKIELDTRRVVVELPEGLDDLNRA